MNNPKLVQLMRTFPLCDPEDLFLTIYDLAQKLGLLIDDELPALIEYYFNGSQQKAFFGDAYAENSLIMAAQNMGDTVYLKDKRLDPKMYKESFYNCLYTLNRLSLPRKMHILSFYKFSNVI